MASDADSFEHAKLQKKSKIRKYFAFEFVAIIEKC